MYKVKTNSSVNPALCNEHNIFDMRIAVTIFMLLTMLLPSIVKADGLFDFQMKLAEGGNAEAQYKVGEMYETGFGVEKNRAEAEKWITKAASKGNENAGFKLLYWDVEKNGLKGDNKAKVDELVKKADAGNPQAQYYVGKMHANGVGMKKNPDKAISWLNKAAFVGVLEAEQELVKVRDEKQRQALAKRHAEEKKQSQLKARQEREKLEKQKKLKAQQEAEAKAKASAAASATAAANKKKAEAAALEKAKQEKARQEKLLAQKNAEAEKQRQAQLQAQKEAEAKQKQRKTQFESDPCSGKSARFLSTCR